MNNLSKKDVHQKIAKVLSSRLNNPKFVVKALEQIRHNGLDQATEKHLSEVIEEKKKETR